MQEHKDNEIIQADVDKLEKLMEKAKTDLSEGKVDSIVISTIQIGDEFEIKNLKFKVTDRFSTDGTIRAKLIGFEDAPP